MNDVKKLNEDQIIELEQEHNICIDRETLQYNNDSHDAQYGWEPLPEEWTKGMKMDTNKTEKRALLTKTKQYGIWTRQLYYIGTVVSDNSDKWHWLGDREWEDIGGLIFASRQDAVDYLQELEDSTYYLGHGEYAPPDYRIKK